jgi:hypothetical protein
VREWVAGDEEATHSDRYLAARLAAATADYKGVALTTFLLGAGVGVFVWLGIGILAEHWVVAGGLPRWLRWTWLAAGLVALVAAALRWLVPLMRYRVNLVYAARQIEREHPELHNDLVNTVLVKARPEGSPSVVVTSLKRRTARRLADVAGSTTMDRTSAVRLAYALMAAVGLACLYEVVAPKSLLVSAARLVAPWIGWTAPSRVRIDGPRLAWRLPDEPGAAGAADVRRRMTIDGGRAVVVRGRQVEVTAGIRGLRAGEQPVPLEDRRGALFCDHVERFAQGKQEMLRRSARIFAIVLFALARGPIPVGRPQARVFMHLPRPRAGCDEAQSRWRHQSLLRCGHRDVDAPAVHLEWHAGE